MATIKIAVTAELRSKLTPESPGFQPAILESLHAFYHSPEYLEASKVMLRAYLDWCKSGADVLVEQ